MPRIIYIVHRGAGRLRFRLSWLHDAREEGEPIADALSALNGVSEVRVRTFTGSVLCLYDPARIDEARLGAELRRLTGVDRCIEPGEETPGELAAMLEHSNEEGSTLARAAVRAAKGINIDLLRFSHGRVSLGTLVAFCLLGSSAWKLASTQELELPEWHQLAWWGFRSFATLEESVIEREEAALSAPADDGD